MLHLRGQAVQQGRVQIESLGVWLEGEVEAELIVDALRERKRGGGGEYYSFGVEKENMDFASRTKMHVRFASNSSSL
jgi:hypothetical protein